MEKAIGKRLANMAKVKEYIRNNKIKILSLSILLFIFIGALAFIKNDYFLYKEIIVHVISVSETEISGNDEMEPRYTQNMEARIMNGENKGHIIQFENERSYSGLFDYDISKGDDVFVKLNSDLSFSNVDGFKRDFWVALEAAIFCYALILVADKRSGLIFLSTFVNIIIFTLILFLNSKSIDLFALFVLGTLLFTVLTLVIIGGFNKKTLAAIISTLISVVIMMATAIVCFNIFNHDIHYETIEFSEYLLEFKNVFYSGVLISGLGAIMDITIIISSAVNELINKDPEISSKELKKSAWIIVQDISGTMMNVLFFSCVAGALPILIFVIRNGQITYAFSYYGSAEIIRALIGCIGIVLAGPVSYLVNVILRKRWKL